MSANQHEMGDRAGGHVRIHSVRFVSTVLLLLATSSLIIVTIRQLPSTVWMQGLAFGLGVVFTLVNASFLEWLVHRYVYHRNWIPGLRRIYAIHHPGHHFAIFPTWRYVSDGPPHRHRIFRRDAEPLHSSSPGNALVKLAHFGFYMTIGCVCLWVPAWLMTRNIWFVAGLVVTSVVVSDLFVRVHDAIHYPGSHSWIQAQPWFAFLDRHHFIHHVDTEANVNFLLPLADWLLGTLRLSLTSSELAKHGTLKEAKASPIGQSAPARDVAQPRWADSEESGQTRIVREPLAHQDD